MTEWTPADMNKHNAELEQDQEQLEKMGMDMTMWNGGDGYIFGLIVLIKFEICNSIDWPKFFIFYIDLCMRYNLNVLYWTFI